MIRCWNCKDPVDYEDEDNFVYIGSLSTFLCGTCREMSTNWRPGIKSEHEALTRDI